MLNSFFFIKYFSLQKKKHMLLKEVKKAFKKIAKGIKKFKFSICNFIS
jgi:hypothetical protein